MQIYSNLRAGIPLQVGRFPQIYHCRFTEICWQKFIPQFADLLQSASRNSPLGCQISSNLPLQIYSNLLVEIHPPVCRFTNICWKKFPPVCRFTKICWQEFPSSVADFLKSATAHLLKSATADLLISAGRNSPNLQIYSNLSAGILLQGGRFPQISYSRFPQISHCRYTQICWQKLTPRLLDFLKSTTAD